MKLASKHVLAFKQSRHKRIVRLSKYPATASFRIMKSFRSGKLSIYSKIIFSRCIPRLTKHGRTIARSMSYKITNLGQIRRRGGVLYRRVYLEFRLLNLNSSAISRRVR